MVAGMTHRTREISPIEILELRDAIDNVSADLVRIRHKYVNAYASIWTGGSAKADNCEVAPKRTTEAMRKLRSAEDLLSEASHELTMYFVVGDPTEEEEK